MKIVQILHDAGSRPGRHGFLVLCDDGSVWRQAYVEKQVQHGVVSADGKSYTDPVPIIRDALFVPVWQRAEEFDELPKEWTPEDENERGR